MMDEADGWLTFRNDDGEFRFTMWTHEPSHRCVTVHRSRRGQWIDAVWGPEPAEGKNAEGYSVTCTLRDEGGEPIDGDGFWVESFALAIKLSRKYREAVVGQTYQPNGSVQLTLDDALGGAP